MVADTVLEKRWQPTKLSTHVRMRLTAAKAGENLIMKSPSPVAA
jgi:hypothetical protein